MNFRWKGLRESMKSLLCFRPSFLRAIIIKINITIQNFNVIPLFFSKFQNYYFVGEYQVTKQSKPQTNQSIHAVFFHFLNVLFHKIKKIQIMKTEKKIDFWNILKNPSHRKYVCYILSSSFFTTYLLMQYRLNVE